jgi:hypothetical protein
MSRLEETEWCLWAQPAEHNTTCQYVVVNVITHVVMLPAIAVLIMQQWLLWVCSFVDTSLQE